MPSTDIWGLFPSLAVIVLIGAAMGFALRFIWKEFKAWMAEWQASQDKARAEERDKQRAWEAAQNQGWQNFMQKIETHHTDEEARNRTTLAEVVASMESIAQAVKGLNQTLSDHILEDAARFEVLLSQDQRATVERKTQPRRSGAAKGKEG